MQSWLFVTLISILNTLVLMGKKAIHYTAHCDTSSYCRRTAASSFGGVPIIEHQKEAVKLLFDSREALRLLASTFTQVDKFCSSCLHCHRKVLGLNLRADTLSGSLHVLPVTFLKVLRLPPTVQRHAAKVNRRF